ncbi:hypothetical protein CPB86DRAFT_792295 [Serendipita vermifera]|nr:hypothetical protein CPB86DRAFT_792295 [Serendipita vermifera]
MVETYVPTKGAWSLGQTLLIVDLRPHLPCTASHGSTIYNPLMRWRNLQISARHDVMQLSSNSLFPTAPPIDTLGSIDDLLRGISHDASLENSMTSTDLFWFAHQFSIESYRNMQPCIRYLLEPHHSPYSTSGSPRTNTIPITSSETFVLDATPANNTLESYSNLGLSTWNLPSSAVTSAETCTPSQSWTTGQQMTFDFPTTGLECLLCNRTFTSRKGADSCFFQHWGMKPFPCYGACGEESCTKSYTSRDGLRRHCIPLEQKIVVCHKCGQARSKQNISRHRKTCVWSAD